MAVLTRSAARRQSLAASSPRRGPQANNSIPITSTVATNDTTMHPTFRTTLIDSAGVVVTVAPSATGQGVHTKWTYDTFPEYPHEHTDSDLQMPKNDQSLFPILMDGSATPTSSKDDPQYITPATRNSFDPTSVLCTPQKGIRAKPLRRSPYHIDPLTDESLLSSQSYQSALQDAIQNTDDSHSSSLNLYAPQLESILEEGEHRDIFNARQPASGDPGLGKPVSLRKAPLVRYDTIKWDDGCGEPSITGNPGKKASPLARCTESGPKPLLGPHDTQIIGPSGTHLLLGASAGPILDTQIVEPKDSLEDIEMDMDGHLDGPIGAKGEKLGPDGRQRLGPSGTLLHYDVNRLMDKFMDQRMEALGFANRNAAERTRRLGPN